MSKSKLRPVVRPKIQPGHVASVRTHDGRPLYLLVTEEAPRQKRACAFPHKDRRPGRGSMGFS